MALAWSLASAVVMAESEPQQHEIWFDDLIGVEALPAAEGEHLARHLSELVLAAKRAAPLPVDLRADRAPRMIFLSLSDGGARAQVLRAEGYGVTAVVERLRAALLSLKKQGFMTRALRVDVVTGVERVRVRSGRPMSFPRSLYGLAWERPVRLAFLADEVVVRTLINSDQELRWRNIEKQPDAVAWRPQLDRLQTSADFPLFRFATLAFYSDGETSWPLFRGHRRFADLDPEQLLQHAELAGHYLVRSVGEKGRFVYAYLPKTNEVKDKYNILRHCGSLYSMLELYEVTADRELLAAAERALEYLEREHLERCRVGEVETACIVEDGVVKLGGNALAMIALAKHASVTGAKRYLPLIDDLGRWILLTQSAVGEFEIHKQTHPAGEISDFVSGYYPGEALLALVRRPDPDPAWLDAAERGARWLIGVRDQGLPSGALNHDHWLLYALAELHRLRPDPVYLQHAARITEAILARQRQRDPEYSDWLGSYYRPPRSTPTATRSEGLSAAYQMMRGAGRDEQARAIRKAIELGIGFQLQTQFLPETVLYLDQPARALGGFRQSLTNYEIRIDYVQHNLSALLLLRRLLLDEITPSPRSQGVGRP